MLRQLLVLAALLCICPAQAQLLWQQGTGTSTFDESSSGGFLAVPGGYLSVGRGSGYNNPNYLYFAKLSPSGTVLWQRTQTVAHRNIESMEVLGAAADASGQFYVTGECTELVPQHTTSNGLYSFGMLVKFTATGDTLWSRVLRGTDTSRYWKLTVTSDGGTVVTGDNDTDHFIAKFSAAGQELWHRSYVSNNKLTGYFMGITLLPSGGFLVFQAPYAALNQPARYLLLDAQGQLVSTHPAHSYGHYSLATDAVGNVLASAGRLYKLSPVGDTLWSRQYTQYGAKVEVRLAVPVPGSSNYLLAGTRPNAVDADISLLLVNGSTGVVLRDTVLVRYGGNEVPTGVQFDSQGNYVVGLWTDDNGPIGYADQVTFALRNWNRYLLPTRAGQAAALAYEAYPNPATATERVRVTVAGTAYTGAYEVRDVTGRLVQAGEQLPATGLAVAGLPVGLYLLRVQQQDMWLPAVRLQVN